VHRGHDVRIFFKECQTLAAAGYDVHLLAPPPMEPGSERVATHPVAALRGANELWRVVSSLPSLARAIRAAGASVYHLHDPHLIPLGILLKLRGALIVYDAHEDSPVQARSIYAGRRLAAAFHSHAWRLLERAAGSLFDAVVCATPRIASRYPAGKTVLVRNFPLKQEFAVPQLDGQRPPQRERQRQVVYVGNITTIRGIREMVRAMELVDPGLGAGLLLLGDFSRAEPRLREEVSAMAGWRRVEFLGYRTRTEVVDTLARARVGLVLLHPRPNYVEALPVKLFEYMAAGLPVVASDFPLWRRIVEDAGCGVLVDPLDPRSAAEAITHLLTHPDEADEMGRRGQEAFFEHYNWEAEGTRLLTAYERLGRRLLT
jgi:glycosyltransferase involved in cell wall biosynthesis